MQIKSLNLVTLATSVSQFGMEKGSRVLSPGEKEKEIRLYGTEVNWKLDWREVGRNHVASLKDGEGSSSGGNSVFRF